MGLNQKYTNKEWLYHYYVIKKMSTYKIGKLVGRDPKTIYSYLKKFDIPTRKRGENLSRNGKDNYMKNNKINPMKGRKHSEKTKRIIGAKSSVPKPALRGKNNGMYGRKGKLNPNYIDGSSSERQCLYASSKWKDIVRRVFKRDKYLCQRCGNVSKYDNPLHSHHLKSWANNKKERFEIDNLITLCKNVIILCIAKRI